MLSCSAMSREFKYPAVQAAKLKKADETTIASADSAFLESFLFAPNLLYRDSGATNQTL